MPRQKLTTAVLIAVFTLGGFLLGRAVSQTKVNPQSQASAPKQNSIFSSQTANIQGEITKIDGQTLTIKSNNGQTADFPISKRAVIYQFKPGSTTASASSDLKNIETGKPVVVILELKDATYQVISISYIKRPSSIPSK